METNIIFFEEVDSTNDCLRRMAAEGAEEGLVVHAATQTSGKGRRGRVWESAKKDNLYFSILLRPEMTPNQAPMLTLVMAYAVAKVLEKKFGVCPQIKWPNDILVAGKKVCGILTEMFLKGSKIDFIVLGCGVNVNQMAFSQELESKATSLKCATGIQWDAQKLLQEILETFGCWYSVFLQEGNLGFLQEDYNQLLVNREREVLVQEPEREYTAFAKGINAAGELVVKREDGSEECVFAGEVSVRGIYGYV